MTRLILYTDGAARGNPGPAAIGVVVADASGNELEAIGKTIGRATNNEAEYRALLFGLERAAVHHATALEIRTDSELLDRQLRGLYKVRAENLKGLHQQANRALARLHYTIRHIPRNANRRADQLANEALDRANQP